MTPARYIVLGFLGVIAVGTILLVLPFSSASGKTIGFVPALFTSTTAVCVTGLTVIDPATQLSISDKSSFCCSYKSAVSGS